MMRWAVLLLLVLAYWVPSSAFALNMDKGEALAACEAWIAANPPAAVGYVCIDQPHPDPSPFLSQGGYQVAWNDAGHGATGNYFGYYMNGCKAGEVVPNGTNYEHRTSGDNCRVSDRCSMSMAITICPAGVDCSQDEPWKLNGNRCPALPAGTAPPPIPTKPADETSNPDGSKTFCESNSGTCVTSGPAAPSAPPPPPDPTKPNDSTDNTTHTDNSGSTSTTTGTSTTTNNGGGSTGGGSTGGGSTGGGDPGGGGTGDGGTGDGVSGGSTTAHSSTTSTPASSSSSSSKCTTGVCDVGNADGDLGGMYTPGGDSVGSVFGAFAAQAGQSPLIGAATGFFTVNVSGSCPVWHIPGNAYWGEAGFDFAFFCASGFLAILQLAGMLVLAVGAFSAFRIALY